MRCLGVSVFAASPLSSNLRLVTMPMAKGPRSKAIKQSVTHGRIPRVNSSRFTGQLQSHRSEISKAELDGILCVTQ